MNVELLSPLAMIICTLHEWGGKKPTHWIKLVAKRQGKQFARCQMPEAQIFFNWLNFTIENRSWIRKETIDACISHGNISWHIVTCHIKTTLTMSSTFQLNRIISFVICAIEFKWEQKFHESQRYKTQTPEWKWKKKLKKKNERRNNMQKINKYKYFSISLSSTR